MRRIRLRARRPGAPLIIAMLALFVALSGTGIAAGVVPLAKRALTADKAKVANVANVAKNSLKLEGQTAAHVAATPGPADTLNGQTAAQIIAAASAAGSLKLTIHSTGWHLDNSHQAIDWYANCNAGEKAVGGGWDETEGDAKFPYNRPKPDDSGWWLKTIADGDAGAPAGGTVWVICTPST